MSSKLKNTLWPVGALTWAIMATVTTCKTVLKDTLFRKTINTFFPMTINLFRLFTLFQYQIGSPFPPCTGTLFPFSPAGSLIVVQITLLAGSAFSNSHLP